MPPPDDDIQHLGALLAQSHAWFVHECERRLAASGYPDLLVTHGINVLRHLTAGSTVSVAQLVASSTVTKQAISQQLAYLVDHDYVVVTADESDRRAKAVTLTERGEGSRRAIREIWVDIEKDIAEILGAEAAAILRRSLTVLAELSARAERRDEEERRSSAGCG